MIEQKYTPGPWRWNKSFRHIYGPAGELVASAPNKANGELLASSLGLLKALERILRFYYPCDRKCCRNPKLNDDCPQRAARHFAEEALAKAKGESEIPAKVGGGL